MRNRPTTRNEPFGPMRKTNNSNMMAAVASGAFPANAGPKRGALAVANYGKGRWVYVGLGLWRELPAGVDGAYQLLANLISPK